jgi:hypothetical protein
MRGSSSRRDIASSIALAAIDAPKNCRNASFSPHATRSALSTKHRNSATNGSG